MSSTSLSTNRSIDKSSHPASKNWFVLAAGIFVLGAIKLFLVADQQVPPMYWPHDELLFVNWALALIEGRWLGEYNALSHTKLPGYSLWIAGMAEAGIPLLLSQHIVQLSGALLVMVIASYLGASRWEVLFVGAFIVFAPHSFSYFQTRTPRSDL